MSSGRASKDDTFKEALYIEYGICPPIACPSYIV